MEINTFTESEGAALLLKYLSTSKYPPQEQECAKELSGLMSGLPFAIVQMAGHIRSRKLSVQKFLAKRFNTSDRSFSPYYRGSITTVWNLTFNTLSLEEGKILGILSFLNPDSIPRNVFEQCIESLPQGWEFINDEWR